MTIDTNLFWELLKESRLVDLDRITALSEEFNGAVLAQPKVVASGQTAAKWLIKKKLITPYQAKILVAGHSGPLIFGNYVVIDKVESGPLKDCFLAKHTPTKYPVLLEFMAATSQLDLTSWKRTEAIVDQIKDVSQSGLVPVYETVTQPSHRFVVSNITKGKSLSEVVPRKGRLPWSDGCTLLAHVANGLVPLHDKGIAHGAVSPSTIWCLKGGKAQIRLAIIPANPTEVDEKTESRFDYLAPEVNSGEQEQTPAADLYSLGCVLFRIISGRTLFPDDDLETKKLQHQSIKPPDLSKYKIPLELQNLLDQLLAKKPERRPDANSVSQQLCEIIGKPDLLDHSQDEDEKVIRAFRKRIAVNQVSQVGLAIESNKPQVDSIGELTTLEEAHAELRPKKSAEELTASIAAKRKGAKWKMPLAIAAALLLMSGIIGTFAYKASQTALVVTPEPKPSPEVEVVEPETPPEDIVDVEPIGNLRLVQQLLPQDDGTSLWETPTFGQPLDLSFHPPAARMVFSVRPAELFNNPEGQLLIRSFGPKLSARIEAWRNNLGLNWDEIEELIVTLHNNESQKYEAFYSIRLTQPTNFEALAERLGADSERLLPDGKAISPASEPDENTFRFVYGSPMAVSQVREMEGAPALSGAINALAERSDAGRHFNFIALRPALFNEHGQDWMSGQMAGFNRKLDLFMQDEIRGAMMSFHLDDGNYFEIVFSQTADLEPRELQDSLETRLRLKRDEVAQFLSSLPSNQYWDKVRLRYDNMLADVYRNLRWDVEYGEVVGNCWLPPMAAHNLIAGSELITAFSSGASIAPATATKAVPQSLQQLLQSKRSLDVTTNPDLGILLAGIRDEIVDEFGSLPFKFEIRLIGNDLLKDGITQNQRPGDFKMTDQTFADILTEIMVRCNPNKDITGPTDENCKLVWVLGPDPNSPDQMAILITTRDGVANRNLEMPAAFRTE